MQKKCAYCGKIGDLTKEHIIPNFLCKKHPKQNFGYSQKADRYITWQAVIKDVCGDCNNGPLSELDEYGEEFYTKNKCYRNFTSRKNIGLFYDYETLLRWFLKITYNCIRAHKQNLPDILFQAVPFIIDGKKIKQFRSEIYIEVIKDYILKGDDWKSVPEEIQKLGRLPAEFFRIGAMNYSNIDISNFISRYIVINSYFFYIFIFPINFDVSDEKKLLRTFKEKIGQAAKLNPKNKHINFKVSKRDSLQAYEEQGNTELDKWRNHRMSVEGSYFVK